MAKLGYTFYPKDWNNSDAVFELNLNERGLYREFIDLAMLNDNKTKLNTKVWLRKFNTHCKELDEIIEKLKSLDLLTINDGFLFIPSCEPRLQLSRGGKKGGETSKPTPKPTIKPTPKPTPNQKKEKGKEKKEKEIKQEVLNSPEWINQICKVKKLKTEMVTIYLGTFLDDLELKDDLSKGIKEVREHFINWLTKEMLKNPTTTGNGQIKAKTPIF